MDTKLKTKIRMIDRPTLLGAVSIPFKDYKKVNSLLSEVYVHLAHMEYNLSGDYDAAVLKKMRKAASRLRMQLRVPSEHPARKHLIRDPSPKR